MLSRSTISNANSRKFVRDFRESGPIRLADNEVHVWRCNLDLPPFDLELLSRDLSFHEWTKANRFRFEVHQNRYIAAHGMLRALLGQYLAVHPGDIQFSESSYGKPYIPGELSVEFNLAHSEELMLIGVSRCPVGVDIEKDRKLDDVELLVRTVLSDGELDFWKILPTSEKQAAFFKLWTRKEALLKAIGCGIAEHTRSVSVYLGAAPLDCPRDLSAKIWTVLNLTPAEGFTSALATVIENPLVVEKQFSPTS